MWPVGQQVDELGAQLTGGVQIGLAHDDQDMLFGLPQRDDHQRGWPVCLAWHRTGRCGATETRVRAHVFLCTLAPYLVWHLRQTWAPLTFADEQRPEALDPVAPALRSAAAERKAATKTTGDDLPAHSLSSLLDHLATLTRNEVRFLTVADQPVVQQLALPTPTQRRAFELLGRPIPLTLAWSEPTQAPQQQPRSGQVRSASFKPLKIT